jgi:autotransporter-associated beta strand protein
VTNVQLAADAVIGGTNGWFQIGSQGGTVGGIDGKGHVLTKVGSSTIVLKQNALSALSTAVVANGRYVLTTSNPFGSSALVILSNNAAMDTWGEGNSGWNGITLPNSLVIGPGGGQMRNSQGAWYGHANYDTYNGAITLNDTLTLLNTSTYMGNPNPTVMTHGTMVFNGVFSGPGGLSCNASNGFGGNVITLNGVNTYTGPTTVAGGGGTLAITTGQRGGGAYTVLDGSVLDVGPATGFTSVPMSSLTLGNSSGAVLSLARLTSLSTLNAPIMITNFTAFGVTTILVPGFAFTAPGQYPLIKYTNTLASGGSFLAGGAVRGLPGYISNNVANSSIDLVVPGDSPVLWVGNAGNTWDIGSTANRLYHSASTTYQQTGSVGDAVAFDDTGLLTTVNLAAPVSPALVVVTNSTKAYTFTNSNIIGTTALLKEGPGMLTLSNGANTFIGGTLISGGTVRLGSDGAVNNSSGVVTITPGGTLDLNNYNPSGITINASGAGVGGNGAIVDNYSPSAGNTRGPGTINMMGDLTVGGTNRWSMRNGAHILNCPTNGYSLIKVGPGILDFSAATVSTNLGDLIILGGTFSHRNANAGGMGSLAYKVRVGAGATLDYNTTPPPTLKTVVCSNTATIQTDSAGIIVANPIILDGGTVYFDANYNNTATYTNVISGAGGIRFNYNSQITFTAPNTYTGNTEVRTGPGAGPAAYLKLSGVGSIASSANIILDGGGLTNYAGGAILDASARTDGTLTLVSGQTLRGDTGSSVKGNVVAVSGSTIWPGGPGYIQTMAFSNSLTFQAGSICAMDVNKDVTNLDTISVTGTLTYGGSLQINRLGTNAFAAGDSFKLFNAATYAGSFASVTPAPGAGLAWDTSALATSGTLKVVSGANTTPPNITTSLSGGSLTLAWPADRLGWRLLVQTNNLAHGISLNPLDWGVVAGSANTTNVVIVPDLSKPATFYRLVYP